MEKKDEQRQLRLSYDKSADVLYISFGAPQEAISEESEEGLLIRRHPKTGAVVGLTVLDFKKRFEAPGASALLPIAIGRVSTA